MKKFLFNIMLICFSRSVMALSNSTACDHRAKVIEELATPHSAGQAANCQPPTANRQPPTANQLSTANHQSAPEVDRAAYYKAMRSDNKSLVDAQITELNSAPADVKNAFLGAMIMRKAGIGGSPATKMKLFKQGRQLLEEAIIQDPKNAEFRFLRLMIQENSPGVLGYKKNEQQDSEFIRKSYKTLPEDLQKTIADYNKKSRVLKLQVS